MKRFKELAEELLNEGGEMYPADEMTMKELKIACYAARNILERLEDGQMIQRWQISAIVKASEELSSVYTSMSADEGMEDDEDEMDWDDMEYEEPMYVGFEYPSMYGEETDYEVDVEGLPKMYVKGDNPSQVKNNLRKVVKNPEMIRGVERVAKATLQKIFRDKASGKELEEEKLERHKNTVGAHHLERDSGEHKMYTRYYGSLKRREHTVTDKDDNILGQGLSAASAMSKAKLKKPHRDALMHDDNQIIKVHNTAGSHNVGTQVSTPGTGRWFKDHDAAMAHAKTLPGKIRYADKNGHVD